MKNKQKSDKWLLGKVIRRFPWEYVQGIVLFSALITPDKNETEELKQKKITVGKKVRIVQSWAACEELQNCFSMLND